jgi:hypothetical protein
MRSLVVLTILVAGALVIRSRSRGEVWHVADEQPT